MITKLTKSQIDKFSDYVDEWIEIGLSTDQLDENEAKRCINGVYHQAGLNKPKYIVCDSPLSAAIVAALNSSVGASVRDSVRDSVRASVGASVWDSVGASV